MPLTSYIEAPSQRVTCSGNISGAKINAQRSLHQRPRREWQASFEPSGGLERTPTGAGVRERPGRHRDHQTRQHRNQIPSPDRTRRSFFPGVALIENLLLFGV